MRIKLYTISFLMIFISLSNKINAQVSVTLDAEIRDKTNLDIGFNRRSDAGTWWTDNSFISLVSEMNPDIVRYPGGTQGNYWDWQTGKFIPNAGKTWGSKEILHIPEFVNALPERTKIVYMVNMARPTPATGIDVNADEATLKSMVTLNLKITDMLNAIAEFEAQGKLPYAIELGNEFYFGNEEAGIFEIVEDGTNYYSGWDEVNNQPYSASSKKEANVFNAKFYLQQCKTIVTAIKNQYPNMKFALCTTKMGNGNSTRDYWNNTIFDELQNNPDLATLKNDIYAVTQHHYINDDYGDATVINDNSSAEVAISEGSEYPQEKQPDYDLVPAQYKIWYTEYGVTKENAEETWATGIRSAIYALSWIDLGDKVGQLDYHYITNNNTVKYDNPMLLAPIGIATKMLQLAFADMTEMQKINFTNNPVSANGVKSLHGYKFKNNEKETAFIINISDNNFSQIQTDGLFTYTGQYHMVQYYSNMPYISGVYEGHSNINSVSYDTNDDLYSHRFSISVIEVDKGEVSVKDNFENKIKVFPNPFTEKIIIKDIDLNENNISIYNILGQYVTNLVSITAYGQNIEIKTSKLKSGVYLLKINGKRYKIVKGGR